MKNLQMSLKTKWFQMTEINIKPEDYRELNPYWCNRFLLFEGKKMTLAWWFLNFFEGRSIQKTRISLIANTEFNKFDFNIMTLGYPKSTDLEKFLKFEHKGIEIRTGNTEWGAEEGKFYFVIMHGNKINILR